MKNINVTFEDEEFELLLTIKDELSWREFILTLVTPAKNTSRGVVGQKGDDDNERDNKEI